MSRTSVFALYTFTLLAGIFIGAQNEWGPLTRAAQAKSLDPAAADNAYNELRNRPSPLQDGSELLVKISRLTTNSVVHIQSERKKAKGGIVEETGSGVIVESHKAKGFFVVTNSHVVSSATLSNISIHLHDGRVLHPTQIWSDEKTDVAIMKVSPTDLQAARWGDSDKTDIGHMVLAMGSPFGLSQSITYGIISAKGRRSLKLGDASDVKFQDFLQTDAAINPGNSGGPLIDLKGQVIGINTAIASNSGGNEGIGFSIPSNLVRLVIDQLLEHGKVVRAYLGVKLDPNFNYETALRLKLDRVRGARVMEVYSNTPASRANLQFDDVVLTFDGVEVLDENHLINLVSQRPINQKVKAVIYRAGKHLTVDIVVGDRTELEERAEVPSTPGMGVRVESLGLTLHKLDADIASQLGLQNTAQGLLVLNIERDGPLTGDIQVYDLIEEVARTPVATVEELEDVLSNAEMTESLLVKIRRSENGRMQSQVVVLHR